MSRGRLAQRIAAQPGNARAHAGHMRPCTDADGKPIPPMPHVMPLSVVYMSGDAQVVEQGLPLVTNRGVVPATGTGRWDQVVAAGNA
jgi:hypothetical protein